MLVSPVHRHTATLNVYPLSIAIYEDPLMMGLVPALVKWLLPFIIWLSYDSQKSKEDLLMTVASGGEVGTSCEWRSRSQTAAELWRHPTKTRCRPFYITIVPLSIFLSLSLFATQRFCRFFSQLKLRCPRPPPSFSCLFLVWTTVTIFANCP